MSEPVVCPTCSTTILVGDRCPIERGSSRCMETIGHSGCHWTDNGHADGSVLVWSGAMHRRSCPGRLSLTNWCEAKPGHEGPHNNRRGVTWIEEPDE